MSTVEMSETQALATEGTSMEAQAAGLAIRDTPSYERAAEMLKAVKLYLRRVAEVFDPIVDAAHKAHKTAVAQRDGVKRHALTAEATIKGRMASYEQELERARRAAEEAARRERERLEAEARAAAEAESARLRKEAEDRAIEAAAAAEARGDTQAAERIIAAPVEAPVVVVAPVFVPPVEAPAPPRVEGVSYRDNWCAEVTDFAALVRAVAEGRASLALIKADEVALNGMARALKDAMRVPGVRAVNQRTVAVRA